MSPKVPQSKQDLEGQLADQLGFLRASSAAFDAGELSEAKRLALAVRVLVHDTPKSKSLLTQLDLKGNPFISTAIPYVKGNLLGHQGLVLVAMTSSGARYVPPLDGGPGKARSVPFEEWWERTIFADSAGHQLSRRDLILIMANQDGGGHVDPGLEPDYHRIVREHSISMRQVKGEVSVPISGIERAAVRQVAHELLKTLVPGYERQPDLSGVNVLVSEPALVQGTLDMQSDFDHYPRAPARRLPAPAGPARNAPCPCGSRKRFKHCHGKSRR